MYPSPSSMMLADTLPFLFVNGGTTTASGSTATIDIAAAGAQAGDYMLIFWNVGTSVAITGGAGGWTAETPLTPSGTGAVGCHHKSLVSGDLTTVTINGLANAAPVLWIVVRRVNSVSLRASATATGTASSLTFTGFNRIGNNVGFLSILIEATSSGITRPAGWDQRVSYTPGFSGGKIATLDPANYQNGDNIVWTGLETGGFEPGAFLFELVR